MVAGQLLMQLDDTSQQVSFHAAQARVDMAQANLSNLLTGRREAENAVIRASLERATVEQHQAQTTLDRSVKLLARNLVAPAKV